ncbi:MAG: Mur ligase family protein, partial [Thermoanaerobaculia bacterium]
MSSVTVPLQGLAWLDALGPQKIRPGLSRTFALLASLGNPQSSFQSILIGGTNGKGSTAASISAILAAAGVPCGLYTSPHLVSVTERVRLQDRDISHAALDDALALVAAVAPPGERSPTYFEALTVAAFELFRRARVRVAVVEVGIGGRLDATNVLSPGVSVVTNVTADHLDVLGPALEDVAREKAGIFRKGQPALVGADGTAEGPRAVLHVEARRAGARLVEIAPSSRWAGL